MTLYMDAEPISQSQNGHGATVVEDEPRFARRDLDRLLDAFGEMVDTLTGPIGRVVGSEKEPAGAHQFCIWASENARTLDVGHIVVAFSEDAAVVGVVDEPRRYSDLRTFLDDFYDRHLEEALEDEPPTRRPEILVFCVNVLATKHVRDDVTSHRPPVAGPVYFATTDAIDFALGKKNFSGVAIPALMHTNGNAEREGGDEKLDSNGNIVFQRAPIWLDEDYLLGPEAGHANWTGQSGLATKTSHALFLTSAVFQQMRREGKTVATLMFNVKGPDLLWLDKPAVPEPGMETAYEAAKFRGLSRDDREAYDALGLFPQPFEHLRVFAPFKPTQEPRIGHGEEAIYLERERSKSAGRLNTLRTAPGETQCVYPILWQLRPLLYSAHKVFERDDLDDKLWGFIAEIRDDRRIESLGQLNSLFAEIDAHFEANPDSSDWHGHHKFTIKKARNRFNGLLAKFGGLLTDGLVAYGNLPRVDESFADQEVRVVDIAGCNTNVQELLVSSVVTEVWKKAEREELGVDKVIVFVDELNKYAASGSQGGLRDTLVDIAARGRHLNVVLFGAQQFRSKVDDEILGNCGTSLYGRVGDEEITNASYRSLSDTAKAELLGLPKGRLLVRHAHFRSPLFGTFPRPPVIPGMSGQSVFNDASASTRADSHVGDGLFFLVKRLMKDGAPSKAEVRTEADGFTVETIERICAQVEQNWARLEGTTAAARLTPWRLASKALSDHRDRARR
ncbi:MAG: hypothetical protein QOF73_5318 [Thermomicrobiales bacterium]|jgi:hypothetical protein|nr:hypothetical protein [Thermomicrobiales bacterium]